MEKQSRGIWYRAGRFLKIVDEDGKISGKKKLFRISIAAIALLCLIAAAVYTVFIQPNRQREQYIYMERTVERGDLILGIMETGSIELQTSAIRYDVVLEEEEGGETEGSEEDSESEEDGEKETTRYLEIEEVYAVSGQRMAKGDQLFRLTEDSVKAVEKRLASMLTEAEIALAEARAEYEIQLLEAKSTYDVSMLEAERAEETYQSAKVRTTEKLNSLKAEISLLEAEIADAAKQLEDEALRESLAEAQRVYDAAEQLYQATDPHNVNAHISNYNDWKSAKSRLESVTGTIENLEASMEDNRELIRKKQEEITLLEASMEVEQLNHEGDYESARLGGELAESIYQYTVNSLEESVALAEEEQKEKEENMQTFLEFVGEDGVIYAAEDGLVSSVSYEAGDQLIRTGDILSYVREDAYEVTIDVSEEDISAVAIGDTVDLAMAAYEGETYTGMVSSITTTANDTYASTVSYPVTIQIQGDTSKLYGGMTANVTFVTDRAEDVLYISRRAVKEIDGKSYVYLKTAAGGKKLTEVETGFSDGTNVEIIRGLSERDIIYMESKVSGSQAELMGESGERASGEAQQEEMMPGGGMSEGGFPGGGMPEGGFPGGGFPGGGFPEGGMP